MYKVGEYAWLKSGELIKILAMRYDGLDKILCDYADFDGWGNNRILHKRVSELRSKANIKLKHKEK